MLPVPLLCTCSTWSYEEYPFLWEPTICLLTNVTYSQRINVPGARPGWPALQAGWTGAVGVNRLQAAG